MSDEELLSQIDEEERAMRSLVGFREKFIPAKDDVTPAPFHEEWSNILLNGSGHFAVEAFRESAKTQIVIRANLLHALTYPNEKRSFLVVICATQRTASKKLVEVSREFLSNPDMSRMMTAVRENSGLAFEVEYQTGQSVRIEAYGKGAAVRGLSWGSKRPDLVIIDDPQDEEDARSETVTSSDWDWFLSDVYFLGQSTRIFIIGNNLFLRASPDIHTFTSARPFQSTCKFIACRNRRGDTGNQDWVNPANADKHGEHELPEMVY